MRYTEKWRAMAKAYEQQYYRDMERSEWCDVDNGPEVLAAKERVRLYLDTCKKSKANYGYIVDRVFIPEEHGPDGPVFLYRTDLEKIVK